MIVVNQLSVNLKYLFKESVQDPLVFIFNFFLRFFVFLWQLLDSVILLRSEHANCLSYKMLSFLVSLDELEKVRYRHPSIDD